MIIVNEERELTKEEIDHILIVQDKAIKEFREEDDGLNEEELEAENLANKGIDIFGDRQKN